MSDTPRTDESIAWVKQQLSADACDRDHPYYVLDQIGAVSRQLERELAAVTAERDALLKAAEHFLGFAEGTTESGVVRLLDEECEDCKKCKAVIDAARSKP